MTKSPADLSIVTLYYNSGQHLDHLLTSLANSQLGQYTIQTIVVNNGATDGIVARAEKKFALQSTVNPIFVYSSTNLGFSAGNNFALKQVKPQSKYILFVNDDITFFSNTVKKLLDFLNKNPQVDAATIKVILASTGKLAPETHRGFPTPWNTFWHFFGLGIPKLFPKSKIFHGYLNDHQSYHKTQTIEACQGCFLVVKKQIGDILGWWNEKYFFLGEDLDFCWQLYRHRFRLYLYPHAQVIHHHRASSNKDRQSRLQSAYASTNAMRIFYRDNLMSQYPRPLHWLIWLGIKLLETYRIFRAKYL